MRHYLSAGPLACSLIPLVLDQVSKRLLGLLNPTDGWSLGPLALVQATNRGLAFHLLETLPPGPLAIATQYLPASLWFFFLGFVLYRKAHDSTFSALPFLLVLSGGLSNLGDHFRAGAVVDTLCLHWGERAFTFNVADLAIFVGAAWGLLADYERFVEGRASLRPKA